MGDADLPDSRGSRRLDELRHRLAAAERYKELERRDRFVAAAKLGALALVAVVLMAGIVWAAPRILKIGERPCSWHEHATFRVFVRGEQLSFQHPKFDMGGPGKPGLLPMRAHLHQPDDYTLHLEGACATTSDFFGFVDATLKRESFKLDPYLHNATLLNNEGDRMLRFFLFLPEPGNGTWVEKPDLPGHQPRNGQRILITYGNETASQIQDEQARVPPPRA